MFKTIINAWKVPEVRRRLLLTLLLIVVFRFGTHISVPFVNLELLQAGSTNQGGILGLINLITGGAFARLSVFALSISPYISASIIVQLLGMLLPSFEVMMKEGGEQAKSKINNYTKIIALVLSAIQGIGLYVSYKSVLTQTGILPAIAVVTSLVAGTSFLVWLGGKITKSGIGNGVSLLIFAGIVASVPNQLIGLVYTIFESGKIVIPQLITVISVLIASLALIVAVIYVHIADRKIPIQYARKIVGRKMYGGQNTYIPIKPIMAGVMPVIFASSLITFPAMIIQIFFSDKIAEAGIAKSIYEFSVATSMTNVSPATLALHAFVYMILIIAFTFFYTLATFNPAEIATNIKQSGGYIPGIRPGKPTVDYLSNVVVKLTSFGGIFLCFIAIVPMIAKLFTNIEIGFGGTSILIIVGVAIETVNQLESHLMMKHYKGFLE